MPGLLESGIGTCDQILSGVRVLDLTWGLPGAVATQFLAEAGADVVKVEPPHGDPIRDSPAFASWNRSKRGVVLDLSTRVGRGNLEMLLGSADVVVHGFRPSRARSLDLDDRALGQRHQRLITCSLLGYPAGHPDAERPGWDLLVQARSGLMDEQIGFREGPIALRFPGPSWAGAYLASAGIVARLIERERDGRGGPVRTSLLQGSLALLSPFWLRAEDPVPDFFNTKHDLGPHTAMYQCADGEWVQIINPGGRLALARLDCIQTTLVGAGFPQGEPDARQMRDLFRFHPSDWWLEELAAADMPAALVSPFGAMLTGHQTSGVLVEVDDAVWGRTRQAAAPFRIHPAASVSRPAPELGAHTDEVLGERRAVAIQERKAARRGLPDCRVLDVGGWVAGPFAASLLSDLGADVIKIEPLTGDPGRAMAHYFESCSRGKRSIAVDLTHPDGQQVLTELVRRADVVHHNHRPRAALKLGVDEAALRSINPDVVLTWVTAFGSSSHDCDRPGFDSVFQAMSGWEVANAGTGNPPLFSRLPTMDVLGGLASLLATLLAVYRQHHVGSATSTEVALLDVATMTQSETLFLLDENRLAPYPVLDGQQLGLGPGYRIYQVTDGWVAIAAVSDGHRARLASLCEVDDLEEVENVLARWETEAVLRKLATAGVPAERVELHYMHDFFDDRNSWASQLAVAHDHPRYGRLEQVGAYWDFGDLPLCLARPAPELGQHTREVLAEAGYQPAEIDSLIEHGVVYQC